PDSNFHRPQPDCRATAVRLAGSPTGSKCEISFKDCQIHCQLRIPGLYNVYNALAAVTVGLKLGVNERRIVTKLAGFSTVFGRFETIRIGRRDATFCLIKNPAGATEVLRTIGLRSEPFELAIMANDHFADGQDVSWYWDTPFEMIAPRINRLTCAGTRANEMALRLKYAGFASEPDIFRTEAEAFSKLLNSTSQTDLYVVSTYTATLNLQRILTKHRIKAAYWKE
ncbi:DUF1727 domain-containing protein, partial [Patescibacteria group bacterium]|nr:DUF1727 domain-containing protein [Patescibacteria group bacterium]